MLNKFCFLCQVEKALQNVADEKKHDSETRNKIKTSTETLNTDTTEVVKVTNIKNTNTSNNSKLKGVSQSILDRIREKEQKKMELAMTRDPKVELRLSRIERLPAMCRILKTYFTSERKVAITMEDCVNKLSDSYSSALQAGTF